jgi:hypothetical protein
MSNLISCGCDNPLPEVNFPDCPEINRSEIVRVYVGKTGHPFNDVEDPAEWAARLSQSWQDPLAIRELVVIGDMALPDASKITISDRRIVTVNKARTINLEIDQVNDENYELVEYFECNPNGLFWIQTIDNKGYGGNEGISGQLQLDLQLDRGNEGIEKLIGVLNWNNKFAPGRFVHPVPVNL